MYSLLLIIIYLAFMSLGLPDSLLGSAWPVLHQDLNVPLSVMGIVSILISFGTITSSLLSSKVTKKFGTQFVTVFSVFLTAFALIGFSLSKEFYHLLIFALPYGLGAGAVDAALNNYVALNYKAKHMNFLHGSWGIGALISPYIMGFALSNQLGWQNGYRFVGFIQFGIAIILLITSFMWKKNKDDRNEEKVEQVHIPIKDVLKIKNVKLLLFGFLAYCAFESLLFNWTTTYFVNIKNVDEALGAMLASLFFIGMTLGRFISGFIADKVNAKHLIKIGYLVAITGLLFIFIPIKSNVLAIIGVIISGIGTGPIYPSLTHSVPGFFGNEKSGSIIGLQMAFAYTGFVITPIIFGLIVNFIGVSLLPVTALIVVLTSFTLIEKLKKNMENKRIS